MFTRQHYKRTAAFLKAARDDMPAIVFCKLVKDFAQMYAADILCCRIPAGTRMRKGKSRGTPCCTAETLEVLDLVPTSWRDSTEVSP